ncbi:acyltransferase domain-containing protein [Corallococcus exiguus]|uniref:type I polyketide synthase n=1 Tax=Corallococcus exiguus TaxID=83462 RepID=UPI001A8E0A5C|nr:type I polyketide synthase [Corallococcus exiguus]MBN8467609.1 acyltransferase domain-containing protein [Corallococcus exiguus]
MTAPLPTANDPTLLKRSLDALKDLRARFEALESRGREPIAIIGLGCRIPGGGETPETLWKMLRGKVDAVSEVPADRWDLSRYYDADVATPGRMHMRYGAFLDAPDRFDPYFFGISPREAEQMDPQQRLFLEVAWHALEDAGLSAKALAGTDTGVFVGANGNDYLQLQLSEPQVLGTYSLVGGTNCIIPNRLSYLLDLRGPSMAFDTACSSSLVAVHQACQSLRHGESSTAIVGGLNLLLSPVVSVAHSKGLPLAPDGRCKTFDARADGYVRGEGCGVVVLKRLSDAIAAGDPVWAVIHGSAVNQDGLSNGLTAPNGGAQRAVIRKALERARLTGSEVGLIEAHGTGTSLGDPIEVEALSEIYGAAEGERRPCALGSIKTNIGHLEAGAGIVGILKVALSLKHGVIPANLHFQALNPHISLDGTRLYVPTESTPWTDPAERRYGAVSSFGAGGTNAHVVLGTLESARPEAAARPSVSGAERSHLLVLSARGRKALSNVARRLADHLTSGAGQHETLEDVCATAALRRTHHDHRVGLVVRTREEALQQLRALQQDVRPPGAWTGTAGRPGRPVFLFPAEPRLSGARLAALGRDCPVFAQALERCRGALQLGQGADGVGEHFAVQVALAELWRSWGVEPGAVLGQGVGEIAAAHVAGALSLEDAARVARACGALLAKGDAAAGALSAALAGLMPRPTAVPLYSADGTVLDGESLGAGAWTRCLRRPEQVSPGIEESLRAGHVLFVELGSEPVLTAPVEEAAARQGLTDVLAVSCLRGSQDALGAMLTSAAALHSAGLGLRLERLLAPHGHFLRLPTYPFERESFWFKERPVTMLASVRSTSLELPRAAVRDTPPEPARRPAEVRAPASPQLAGWAELPERERATKLRSLVHAEVARILKFDAARLDPKGGFFQMGMDSVMAGQLRNRLEQQLGRKFAVTVIFENPTVERLSRHLGTFVTPPPAPATPPREPQPLASQGLSPATGGGTDSIADLLARELEETSSISSKDHLS